MHHGTRFRGHPLPTMYMGDPSSIGTMIGGMHFTAPMPAGPKVLFTAARFRYRPGTLHPPPIGTDPMHTPDRSSRHRPWPRLVPSTPGKFIAAFRCGPETGTLHPRSRGVPFTATLKRYSSLSCMGPHRQMLDHYDEVLFTVHQRWHSKALPSTQPSLKTYSSPQPQKRTQKVHPLKNS